MKNISTALIFVLLLVSCKGNTIFEEPIDLIPKDSMVLVLKDLYLASAAKGVKNKQQQKRVSYMPLVYNKHKIDSMRFSTSNFYYISKVDVYQPMINEVMSLLEKEKAVYANLKKKKDSILTDSIAKINKIILPSFTKKRLDLAKASKIQLAIIGWRSFVTLNSLD